MRNNVVCNIIMFNGQADRQANVRRSGYPLCK